MNYVESKKLFALMKQYGVAHYKTLEVEIRMGHVPDNSIYPDNISKLEPKNDISKIPESQAIPPVEMNIPHHLNEVQGLLKLSDNDLVDKLFPDFSQPTPEAGE